MSMRPPNPNCPIPVVVNLEPGHDYTYVDFIARATNIRLWLFENIDGDAYSAEDFTLIDNNVTLKRYWFARGEDATAFFLTWG